MYFVIFVTQILVGTTNKNPVRKGINAEDQRKRAAVH